MPAGFMETGETTEEGAARESMEEANAHIAIDALLAVYSIPRISQVQIVHRATLVDERVSPGPESQEVSFYTWDQIPWDDLAFPSVHWALRHHHDVIGERDFPPFSRRRRSTWRDGAQALPRMPHLRFGRGEPALSLDLVDIGVNLTNASFRDDVNDVIDRAHAAGVSQMVVTGTSVAGSEAASRLARGRPGALFATAGVHPHDAKECGEDTLARLRELLARDEVVAVGECGLDFNRNYSPPPTQLIWFERQLELAAELSMPLFLHERDASDSFLKLVGAVRDRVPRAVIHCFTGSAEELDAYLELDLHVGLTGWICDERRGAHLHDLVGRIPPDRLMIETDAPYLLPRTLRPRAQVPGATSRCTSSRSLRSVASATGRSEAEVAGPGDIDRAALLRPA